MDESQSLDALANVLGQLEGKPFDLALHATHIRLTQSLEGMQDDALSAMEMMTSFFAAGEDIWLALLKAKEAALDLDTANGVEELLALYKRAERDYLCAYSIQWPPVHPDRKSSDSYTKTTRRAHSCAVRALFGK
jgi:hypothetical protein